MENSRKSKKFDGKKFKKCGLLNFDCPMDSKVYKLLKLLLNKYICLACMMRLEEEAADYVL